MSKYSNLIFVDCEAIGLGCPSMGLMTEFGAVHYDTRFAHHGIVMPHKEHEHLVGEPVPEILRTKHTHDLPIHMIAFNQWLHSLSTGAMPAKWDRGRPWRWTLVSDNPAFDWQWINDAFLRCFGHNPFGFSARRIGDFYAGLANDFSKATDWKSLRVTKHDHNPVNDAMGNCEAFERMLNGERV